MLTYADVCGRIQVDVTITSAEALDAEITSSVVEALTGALRICVGSGD